MWVPLLRSFPENEAHKHFAGDQKLGFGWGGQKVYVENVYVPFRPLKFQDKQKSAKSTQKSAENCEFGSVRPF